MERERVIRWLLGIVITCNLITIIINLIRLGVFR